MPHTPGPWRIMKGTWHIQCETGRIATVKSENESDARLIAAAPDLLVTLIRLLDYAEDCASERDERPGCNDAARAAITKASGHE